MYSQRAYQYHRLWSALGWIGSGLVIGWVCSACMQPDRKATDIQPLTVSAPLSVRDSVAYLFTGHEEYLSTGFDYPVGKPDGKGYYNAQGFGTNDHLGDDWNGRGGGNTDMGDPIYCVSDGVVIEGVNFFGGWGKVIRVAHAWKKGDRLELRESLYAHHSDMLVKRGDWVKKGQKIATIGNAEGIYLAHLHLEIRDSIGMELGGGYSKNTSGYLDPTAFIKTHRKIGN